ncbi:MAG: tetratricopeptide repeat protein, partial [Planctomycetes bacterium]|nr:tetratricopeptide repeat protein [Planctomycetota bacterium]
RELLLGTIQGESDPSERAQAHLMLATCHLGEGNLGESQREAEKALELDPDEADAMSTRTLALGMVSSQGEKLELLEQALAEDPGNATTHYRMGHALLLRRENSRAAEHFREALRLDPSLGEARAMQAVAWRNRYLPAYWAWKHSIWLGRMSGGRRLMIGLAWAALVYLLFMPILELPVDQAEAASTTALCIAGAIICLQPLFDIPLLCRAQTRALLTPGERVVGAAVGMLLGLATIGVFLAWSPESFWQSAANYFAPIAVGVATTLSVLVGHSARWARLVAGFGVILAAGLAIITVTYGFLGEEYSTFFSLYELTLWTCLSVWFAGRMLRRVRSCS